MRARTLLVAALAASALVLTGLTGCASKPHPVYYHNDFQQYASVSELYGKASLVVRARIDGGAEVRAITIGSDGTTIIYTVYKVQIQKVFKGKPASEVIEVKLLGGTKDGVEYIADHPANLTAGRSYLMFLETYPGVPASLLNPVQAHYELDATGKANPAGENKLRVSEAELDLLSTDK